MKNYTTDELNLIKNFLERKKEELEKDLIERDIIIDKTTSWERNAHLMIRNNTVTKIEHIKELLFEL